MQYGMNLWATATATATVTAAAAATARGLCKPVCTLDACGTLHPKTANRHAAAAPAVHGCLCADGRLSPAQWQAAPAPQFAADKYTMSLCLSKHSLHTHNPVRSPVGIVNPVDIVWPIHTVAGDCW